VIFKYFLYTVFRGERRNGHMGRRASPKGAPLPQVYMSCAEPTHTSLRADQVAAWISESWIPLHPQLNLDTVWASYTSFDDVVLKKIPDEARFAGYRFDSYRPEVCPAAYPVDARDRWDVLNQRSGAYVFRFLPDGGGDAVEILGVCYLHGNFQFELSAMAAVPTAHTAIWTSFTNLCNRLAYELDGEVVVIGGRQEAFVPTVDWSEIVLPAGLKESILGDVRGFYDKGAEVYRRLNLKPFRKLLLAGVPGTGKTMLCNALAKWGLDRQYRVIYVSSAQRRQGDETGSTFEKVQEAMYVAASAGCPAMIILEELDAYLNDREKALILNVLDGSESAISEHGTLLISTTNYPEAIDERVLKRPGRLDRIFIIPQTRTTEDAGAMLRRYLGAMWHDDHAALVPTLVGYPGAFIREVAIHALTQVAHDDLPELPLALLSESYERLKEQLDARDAFLLERTGENGHVPV
jgi:hypothetical protein